MKKLIRFSLVLFLLELQSTAGNTSEQGCVERGVGVETQCRDLCSNHGGWASRAENGSRCAEPTPLTCICND